MFIDQFYKFVQFLTAKDFNGYVNPEQFSMVYNQASQELYNKYRGLIEEYQPDNKPENPNSRDRNRIGDGQNGSVDDALSPFQGTAQITINSKGIGQCPADYAGLLSIRKLKYNSKPNNPQWVNIDVLSPGEFANRTMSRIKRPSHNYPVCMFIGDTMQFVPYDLVYCSMDYRHVPITGVWGYTLVNGRPVFNPTTSQETDWEVPQHIQLKMRIARYFGIFLNEGEVVQISAGTINTGE